MQRRHFLTGAAAATVAGSAAGSFPKPALSQGMRELKMTMPWPKNFPGLGTGADRLAKRITDMSDGKLTVKTFAGGELVPPLEEFDAVSGGTADLYHAPDYYYQGKAKALNFFTTVPYGFTADELTSWLRFGGGQELWDELAADFGIKPLLTGNTGVQMGGWFRKEINSLDDLQGLKFRIPGLGGEVFRRVGVQTLNLPPGEIFGALQSGAIDAADWVGPWNDLAFGFYKVAKYYYYPGFHEPGSALNLGVNRKVWDSLSASEQEILHAATMAENSTMLAEFDARNGDALDTLVNEHGIQTRNFTDAMLNRFGEAASEVVAEVAEESDISKRIYESYIAFRRKTVKWSKTATHAYLNARLLPFAYAK